MSLLFRYTVEIHGDLSEVEFEKLESEMESKRVLLSESLQFCAQQSISETSWSSHLTVKVIE